MEVRSTQAALRNSGEALLNAGKDSKGGDKLDKNDFLRLLMTQMTNQDPMNPLDSKGMMQQFAQLGTLEQLNNIGKKLDTLNTVQSEISRSNAYTYLDKDVTVRGGSARVIEGEAPPVHYKIPSGSTVQVHIRNENDTRIRTIEMGFQGSGSHRIQWDGLDADGEQVPDGRYVYDVVAESDEGITVPVDLFMTGKVSNVRFEDGRQMIRMNGDDYDATEIIGVSNESERRFGTRDTMRLRTDMTPMPPVLEPKR